MRKRTPPDKYINKLECKRTKNEHKQIPNNCLYCVAVANFCQGLWIMYNWLMKLTILGSGTYQPEKDRVGSGYLIETGQSKICFDFGRGVINRLLESGVHVNQIEAIFISHWHIDHIADLAPLIHITIAAPADLATDWISRKTPLKVYGPKGTIEKVRMLKEIGLLSHKEAPEMEVFELKPGEETKGGDWRLKAYEAIHNPGSFPLAYRLESGGKSFAYSGDSTESEGLRKALQGADLGVIEAGWPEEVEPKTHLTGQRTGKFAQEAGVKKLVLTHVAPYYLKNFDPVSDAKKFFKGEVILAKDLLEIEV